MGALPLTVFTNTIAQSENKKKSVHKHSYDL